MQTTRAASLAIAIGLVTTGCSGGEEDRALFDSGSRLTARTTSFPGGAEILTEWYDAQLETACEFELTADGQHHCRPSAGLFDPVYSTSDCSRESALVVMSESACAGDEAPRYAISKEAVDDCSLGRRVYAIEYGDRYVGPTVYYKDWTGACLAAQAQPEYQFYKAREVEPQEMVAAERALEGDGRVRRYRFSAEDGAREASALFFDQELGEDCFFYPAADGEYRCIPGDYFQYPPGSGVFADAACTATAKVLDECKQTDRAFTLDTTWCEPRLLGYQLGEVMPSAYLVGSAGECMPVPESLLAGHTVRLLGGELAPTELVAAAESERRGDGRIQEEYRHLEDGTEIFTGWWDSEREDRCGPMTMADGAIRCMPYSRAGADVSNYFGDQECQVNAGVALLPEACTGDDIAYDDIAYTLEGECSELHAYDLAPVSAALYIAPPDTQADECSPVSADVLARLRQIDGPVDLARFEAGSTNGEAAALRLRAPSSEVAGQVQPVRARPPVRRDFRPL